MDLDPKAAYRSMLLEGQIEFLDASKERILDVVEENYFCGFGVC